MENSLPRPFIKGLKEDEINILTDFLFEKINDESFKKEIELGGNSPGLDCITEGMDISGDDTIHILFELYGKCIKVSNSYFYDLKILDKTFQTRKDSNGNWDEFYTT